jgi:hypothetical protein
MEANPEIHLGLDPALFHLSSLMLTMNTKGCFDSSKYKEKGLIFVVTPDLTWVEAYDLAKNKI